MLVWIANLIAQVFAPAKPAATYSLARIRIARRPLRRRVIDN
ncbi:MAG: hypothetical protein OEW90_04195 [Betaproteobacteria bacterium]|nr:hypothetical protein [Betaproteobacteria bacterium]MDH4323321.1 hypothetical protein [Betaproteobacteria bacterium]MDH5211153.1 hypothetical protein [Betaproteobacteria bacterium]